VLITLALISGAGLGSMYGLLALGFYVTYSVSSTVNFAQGSSMMLGAVLCYTFVVTWRLHPALGIVLALLCCALWGMLVERIRFDRARIQTFERFEAAEHRLHERLMAIELREEVERR